MIKLTKKQKDKIFENLINGCKHRNFKVVATYLGKNIISIKIINNNIEYNITDIGIMGCSLLFKEDSTITSLFSASELLKFIENNNKE